VITVVAAVIERDGRVLIGQRKNQGLHALKWEFPGGKVEQNESPEAAVIRELEEELGIRAKVHSEVTRYEYQYPGRPAILLIFFRIVEFTGDPVNLNFERIEWTERERLRNYDFLEGDGDFILKYS
jgi:8-oxo-dGTP diphosphatase